MIDDRTKKFFLEIDGALMPEMPDTIKHFDCRPERYPIVVYKRDVKPFFNHWCDACTFIASFAVEWIGDNMKGQLDIADLYLHDNSIIVRTGNAESEYWSSNPYWNAFTGWIRDANTSREISVVLYALNEGFIKLNITKGENINEKFGAQG